MDFNVGYNCWPQHGAVDVDMAGSPIAINDVAACKASCEAIAECDGVVAIRKGRVREAVCFRKKHIFLDQCDVGNYADTYILHRAVPPSLS